MSIAVVIPYFQRDSGILERALRSVAAQTVAASLQVVVVDDESPVAAEGEVARVPTRPGLTIKLLRKPNGGPAAARNHGLESLDSDVARVAFLDSDDEWTEDHLARATLALDAGHDFFFADHYQLGQDVSAFARAGRLDPAEHPAIVGASGLHSYRGDMVDQIVTGNVIGTSTVVYDYERLSSLRFDEAFYSAGEDYLFWIACALAGARFSFSTDVEVRYGAGVNVYAGSGWGTEGYLRRIQNEMRYRKRLLQLALAPEQRAFVDGRIAALRTEFAQDVLHRLGHRKPIPVEVLRTQLRLDPRSLFAIPTLAGRMTAQAIRNRGS